MVECVHVFVEGSSSVVMPPAEEAAVGADGQPKTVDISTANSSTVDEGVRNIALCSDSGSM